VRKAIEGGSREPLAAEHLGPLLEGQVRGHDQALSLVGRAQDVEEQLDLGDCRVVDFRGAPPPRPGTELAILASLFGQRLTLWLRPSGPLRGSASWGLLPEAIELAVRNLPAAESGRQGSPQRHVGVTTTATTEKPA